MPEERERRAPRPESQHPIGQALYDVNRSYWGPLFKARANGRSAEQIAGLKQNLLLELRGIVAQVEAF